MSQEAERQVQCFWPAARVEALRSYAADTSDTDDTFAKSKRMAWMREFCMEAPSWLETMQASERLRAKVDAALAASRAATAQLEAVLHDLQHMCAPASHDGQDKWAAAIASVPVKDRPVPAAKPRMQQVDWVPIDGPKADAKVVEAVAEADPTPAGRPMAVAKLPAADQQLPAEVQWDRVHGNPPGTTSFKVKLNKLPPDARTRVLGRAAANAYTPGPSEQQLYGRKRAAEIAQSIKDEPEAWEEPHEDAPQAKKAKRAPRTHSRVEMARIQKEHGDEVATFVAHNIMGDAISTRGLRRVMQKFMGTFDDRVAASSRCADHYDVLREWYDGKDVLREYAQGRYLEHADGRCSWWRK